VSPMAAGSGASSFSGVSEFRSLPDSVGSSLTGGSPYFGHAGGQRGNDEFAINLIAPANAQATTNHQAVGKSPAPPAQLPRGKPWLGQIVTLPNGSYVSDPNTATGYLMSPLADLSAVAAAGRETGQTFRHLSARPETAPSAPGYLFARFLVNVGTGGAFDYQRSGNQLFGLLGGGITQLRHFRNVSNFNVGLFCQQAGLSLDETLRTAGRYARLFSSNYDQGQPHGLEQPTAQFIEAGFRAGQSGAYGQVP